MARVWNVAHRGASSEAPENTIAAARLAIEQGADVVEADVRLTADGVPVLMHDATVDRTTAAAGPLNLLTLAEVRALDAGRGEPVPTAAELLGEAVGRVRVNLDIKEIDAAAPALRAVREAGALGSVTFISFLPEVWDWVAEHSPESPLIHLVDSAKALAGVAMPSVGSRTLGAGVGVPYGLVTRDLVELLHRQGVGLFAWTVDDEAEMRRLIDEGVNGIVTNRPGALREVLHQLEESPR